MFRCFAVATAAEVSYRTYSNSAHALKIYRICIVTRTQQAAEADERLRLSQLTHGRLN